MLLIDRRIVSPQNLVAYDQEVQEVCDSQDPAINLPKFCASATVQVCSYLLSHLQSAASVIGASALSGNHTAAVFNRGFGSGMKSRVRLEQIVTDNPYSPLLDSPLTLWATYFALFLFYREMSNRAIMDRYTHKAKRYEEDSYNHFVWLKQNGLPIVVIPFPCPAAELWPYPGTFTSENVSQVPVTVGPVPPGGDYCFAVAWVDINQYNPLARNRADSESAPSPIVQAYIDPGYIASVSIASLRPPDGTPLAGSQMSAALPTVKATHWQLLAGVKGKPLYVQNSSPIPLSITSYQANQSPETDTGMIASPGQTSFDNLVMYDGIMLG